jgi:hypothetical protein
VHLEALVMYFQSGFRLWKSVLHGSFEDPISLRKDTSKDLSECRMPPDAFGTIIVACIRTIVIEFFTTEHYVSMCV